MGLPHETVSIAHLSAADSSTFVETVGFVFEHSPWIAQRAWERRPFSSVGDLHTVMMTVLEEATEEERIALIAAHPNLAGRLAREGRLTPASADEQVSAGLDRLALQERNRFDTLNSDYEARFGFPFVICARDNSKERIVAALEERLHSDRNDEIKTAISEIGKIALYRLRDTVTD